MTNTTSNIDNIESIEGTESIEDIRAKIDALDKKLIALLKQRQDLGLRAGQIKKHRNEIRNDLRIKEVLDKITKEAKKIGLPPNNAREIWAQLIEHNINIEEKIFDEREEKDKTEKKIKL